MEHTRNSINVTRTYKYEPDDCLRALELLLKKSVTEKAVEHAPEPDSRDGTTAKEDTASGLILPD